MNKRSVRMVRSALLVALTSVLCACGKQEPPPDPLKAQRTAIDKAKGLDGVVGASAAEARKKIDEEETK